MSELPQYVRVSVTKADIEQGIPSDPIKCPLVLAIRRALKLTANDEVWVSGDSARIQLGNRNRPRSVRVVFYDISDNAIGWIEAFDRLDPNSPDYKPSSAVKPFRFRMHQA